eukprot:TRINITY_DN64507_c0_g1_i1.p1 TRINITY_DN64507_c0_g1~~TRINITY_DN64507_c0_g1_i1.p1  ORF type:complete len:194 (+),score=41.36 TRINITY_DN64507_c0_g1_i1:106-687(+)
MATNEQANLTRVGSDIVFSRPRGALDFEFYAPADGGKITAYERLVSNGPAVGDQGKKRQFLKQDRLPRDFLRQEAIETGTAKARALLPDAPAKLDPKIKRLMREIRESEGHQTASSDPSFNEYVRRRHKVDHVSQLLMEPKREADDLTTHQKVFYDKGQECSKPDKRHFMKKTFYTEYTEAIVRQKGLQGDKK